eukprot:UN24700
MVSGLSTDKIVFLHFLVHFFCGTMLDRILELLPLRKVQTKKSNKVVLFHSQRLCPRQVLFLARKRINREMPLTTQFTTTKILSFAFCFFKKCHSFPHN